MRRLPTFVLLAALVSAGSRPPLASAADGTRVKVNNRTATTPATWKSEKPANRLRSYQFKLPGAADRAAAELVVMPESSPDVAKNFPRWKAQFVPPEGKTADDLGTTKKLDVPGATVDVLDVSGTWKYRAGGPFDPKAKEVIRDDYRVIWVVVADKDEATHIRLSGPRETVEKHHAEFERWVKSLK